MAGMPGRRRTALASLLIVVLVLASACIADEGGDATPEGSGDLDEADEASEGAPFTLDVHRIRMVGASNAEILGTDASPPEPAAAEQAVEATRKTLENFLNAQFVDEATRFSEEPLQALLGPRARGSLTDADRAGLGVVDLPIEKTFTGPTSTVAQVVLEGSDVRLVHLFYVTKLSVEFADGARSPVDMRGSMTFMPTEEGWRAEAVEVDLDMPDAPSATGSESGGKPEA